MYKKILFVICLFVLLPINAKALMCSNEKKSKFREQAKNIAVNYTYNETDSDITFNIKFDNIPSDFYIYDVNTGDVYYPDGASSVLISNVQKNKSYKYWVYTTDALCEKETLYTHYITIPGYNRYYKDALCKGIEDYKLCNKWLSVNMSYEEWKKEVNKYIDSFKKDQDEEIVEVPKGVFDYVFDFYADYYYFILPGIIILCVVGIIIYNKKHDLF